MLQKVDASATTSSYLAGHWLITLLTAPLLEMPYNFLLGWPKGLMAGLLEMYPLTVLISLIYSIPAFIIYCLVYVYLTKRQVKPVLIKCILIAVAVSGIIITFLFFEIPAFSVIYSVAAIITGALLPIVRVEKK